MAVGLLAYYFSATDLSRLSPALEYLRQYEYIQGKAQQCSAIRATTRGKLSVITRYTDLYETEQLGYWSTFQANVTPSCFVRPASAEQVSYALAISEFTQCPFAVKSGGHAPFAGASNILGGMTIDLRLLNEISINDHKNVTRIGPGNHWIDVYENLTPRNLSVVGGRVTGIGVGGLVLGGGISFFSGRYGWACDGVVNYQVVFADRSIRDVNLTSYPDLYWALRGGGNNFGIVTRLDLETFPQGGMWGGQIYWGAEYNQTVLEAFDHFAVESPKDVDAAVYVGVVYVQPLGDFVTLGELVYARPEADPAILQNFTCIPTTSSPIPTTLRHSNLTDLTQEINRTSPDGLRECFWTLTFRHSQEVMHRGLAIWVEEIQSIKNVSGLVPALVYQVININVLEKMKRNGGNCLGLQDEKEPLIIVNLPVMWSDTLPKEIDDQILATFERVVDRIHEYAQSVGRDHPFIYQNYAGDAPNQNVFAGYGAENLDRLQQISAKYDANCVFQKLQPGYFKVSRA
ncbi:hypothetical protein LTR86_010600 [Recurvomyces mirabilis]|nr:hypothetical protein LTR86_010600 [Recurvomyces mirabilis]